MCGGALKQRKDDDPETVKDRLAVYHKETEPLKGFYEARGVLKTVEDQPTVEGRHGRSCGCWEWPNDHAQVTP